MIFTKMKEIFGFGNDNDSKTKKEEYDLEKLIQYYSSDIAYYKFYVLWILKYCIYDSYSKYLEIRK